MGVVTLPLIDHAHHGTDLTGVADVDTSPTSSQLQMPISPTNCTPAFDRLLLEKFLGLMYARNCSYFCLDMSCVRRFRPL